MALLDPVRQGPPLGGPLALARDHPQAAGLSAWWPTLGAPPVRDYAGAVGAATLQGHATVGGAPVVGRALVLDGTGDYADLGSSARVLSNSGPFTLAWWELVASSPTEFPAVACLMPAGGANRFIVLRSSNAGYAPLTVGRLAGGSAGVRFGLVPTLAASVGVWRHWAVVCTTDPTSTTLADYTAYTDGVAYAANATASLSANASAFNYLGWDGADHAWKGSLADFRVYTRPLSPAEVWQLYDPATRWALYAPTRSVWAVVVSGGASALVTAPAAALSLTAPAPTVQAQQQAAITAPAAVLTLTAPAPTVVGVQQASVSAPAASLALTAPAPAVSTGQVASITAPAASVTLTATALTVTAQQQAAVAAPSGVLTLTAAPPTVVAVSSATVQAVAGVLTLTAGVPTVQIGAAQAPGAVTGGASALDGVTGGASAQDAVLAGVSS